MNENTQKVNQNPILISEQYTVFDKGISKMPDISFDEWITCRFLNTKANTKKEAALYVMGTFENDSGCDQAVPRQNKFAQESSGWALDFDDAPKDFVVTTIKQLTGFRFVIHTTASHGADGKNKYRVIIPFKNPVSAKKTNTNPPDMEYVREGILDIMGVNRFAKTFDPSCLKASQPTYYPTANATFWQGHGDYLNPETLIEKGKEEKKAIRAAVKSKLSATAEEKAFNRLYSPEEATAKFMPNDFSFEGRRGTYHGSSSGTKNNIDLVDNGEMARIWSHSFNYPTPGFPLTAFQIIQFGKFGHLDEKTKIGTRKSNMPSFKCAVKYFKKEIGSKYTMLLEVAEKPMEMGKKNEAPKLEVSARGLFWVFAVSDYLSRKIGLNKVTGQIEATEYIDISPYGSIQADAQIDDEDMILLAAYIENTENVNLISKSKAVKLAIDTVAKQNAFNPITDYLIAQAANRSGAHKTKLETFFIRHLGVKDTPLIREMSYRFFISAVARAFDPGCEVHSGLVLVGRQNLGKSQFLKRICPNPDWHAALISKINDRETERAVITKWLIEFPEGVALEGASDGAVKSTKTREKIALRGVYKTTTKNEYCRHVEIITTNDTQFLREVGRRHWIMECHSKADLTAVSEEMDMVWGLAARAYLDGDTYPQIPDYMGRDLEIHQEKFLRADPWVRIIAKGLNGTEIIHADEILLGEAFLHFRPDMLKSIHKKRVDNILRKLGWEKKIAENYAPWIPTERWPEVKKAMGFSEKEY